MASDAELEALAGRTALVLLYHGAWASPPPALVSGLHNVSPALMHEQLRTIGRFFEWVDVDALAAMPDPRGYAAVTFDDGYRSVFDEALPVFEALDIPFTVYLNGAVFEGGVFWRDKIRLVQNMGWVDAFEAFAEGVPRVPGRRFYRYTKDPGANSARVDAELDRFLATRGAAAPLPRYCVDDVDDLPRHELVSYGNHGHHHYVMSSLDSEEQADEINRTARLLERMSGHRLSRWFSVPFGEARDFDAATAAAVEAAGYRGVLLSRGRAHDAPCRLHGASAVERFMPPAEPSAFWPGAVA